MTAIREMADEIVDTSDMTVHELRHFFMGLSRGSLAGEPRRSPCSASASSTACRSTPISMFDVRCLPNPHFVPALRRRTGRDRAVVGVHGAGRLDARVHRAARGVPAVRRAALRRRGQELPDRGDRLHRRPSPIGHDRRTAAPGPGRRGRRAGAGAAIATWLGRHMRAGRAGRAGPVRLVVGQTRP